jgi:hypothetical protein
MKREEGFAERQKKKRGGEIFSVGSTLPVRTVLRSLRGRMDAPIDTLGMEQYYAMLSPLMRSEF